MKPFSDTDVLLRRIADYLVINASFTCSLGLFHGKMGIVIFFYHYARYSHNPVYEEFADELLGEVYEDIYVDIPVNFENGLSGIGWAIEYLKQQGFVEGDTTSALEDLNLEVKEKDPRRVRDLSFCKGLMGIGYYVACHIDSLKEHTILDFAYLEDLSHSMNRIAIDEKDDLHVMLARFYKDLLRGEVSQIQISLPDCLFSEVVEITTETDWRHIPMGIEKGLAGLGLKLMNI